MGSQNPKSLLKMKADYRIHFKPMYIISNQLKLQIRDILSAAKLNVN